MMTKFDPLPVVPKNRSRLHSIEDHNYWISRNGQCPYCLIGSRPVPKVLVLEAVK